MAEEYTIKDLGRDLKNLDKKLKELTDYLEEKPSDIFNGTLGEDNNEKFIAMIYASKKMEIYSKYFGLNKDKIKYNLEK